MNNEYEQINNFAEKLTNTIIQMFPEKMKHLTGNEVYMRGYIKYWQGCFSEKNINIETCEECFKNIKNLTSPPHYNDFISLILNTEKFKESIANNNIKKEIKLEDISPVFQPTIYENSKSTYDSKSSFETIAMNYHNYKKNNVPEVENEKYRTLTELKKLEKELISLDPEKEFTSVDFDYDKRRKIMSLEQTIVVIRYRVNWLQTLIGNLQYKS